MQNILKKINNSVGNGSVFCVGNGTGFCVGNGRDRSLHSVYKNPYQYKLFHEHDLA
jgi:hypothetical protein